VRRDAEREGRRDAEAGPPESEAARAREGPASSPEEDERRATDDAYAAHRGRFVDGGGVGVRFDGLQLVAAARERAARIVSTLMAARGTRARPASEEEVRTVLGELATEAGAARAKGRFRAFRRLLWPFGPPMK